VSSLHLRTIEALALAIEAKDETTGEHLQRVRVYAMELAKELGLSEDETEALRQPRCCMTLASWRCRSTLFRSRGS
jgi:HD-GYP domain-containing protein (c-di-GMP phosphodiesterase class II)